MPERIQRDLKRKAPGRTNIIREKATKNPKRGGKREKGKRDKTAILGVA